jgi:hypothetical protein
LKLVEEYPNAINSPGTRSLDPWTRADLTIVVLPNISEIQVPQAVLDYPSMTTESEKALLY